MKTTLESTTKIITMQLGNADVPARIWEGVTESGIKVLAYITRIAAPIGEDLSQFERELQEQKPPSAEAAEIPLRLIL